MAVQPTPVDVASRRRMMFVLAAIIVFALGGLLAAFTGEGDFSLRDLVAILFLGLVFSELARL